LRRALMHNRTRCLACRGVLQYAPTEKCQLSAPDLH
jgi:hypothetical protein